MAPSSRGSPGNGGEGGRTGGGGGEGLREGRGGGDDDEEEGEAEVVEDCVGDADAREAEGRLRDAADVGHVDDCRDGVQHHGRVGRNGDRPDFPVVRSIENGQPSSGCDGLDGFFGGRLEFLLTLIKAGQGCCWVV